MSRETGRLEDRVVLVTGASRGIGLAIAQACAREGARVVITARHLDELESARTTFPDESRVLIRTSHVGSRESAIDLAAWVVASCGSLDVLVNNAATNPYFGPLVDIDDARMIKTYEVNQAAIVTHVSAAWYAWMREHGGVVLNVASIGGLSVEPGIGWYNVTKAAVIQLTKQFAWELAPKVRVNAIAPGLVRTAFARGLWEEHEPVVAANIPLGRIGEPEDIASFAVTLVGDDASWVTGQTFVVDGGTTTKPSGAVS